MGKCNFTPDPTIWGPCPRLARHDGPCAHHAIARNEQLDRLKAIETRLGTLDSRLERLTNILEARL